MSQPRKATASAPANIAFVKYWGARDLARVLPVNPSISMTLSVCRSRTTVEWLPEDGDDEVLLRQADGRFAAPGDRFSERARSHLRRLAEWAGLAAGDGRFRVATENSFPAAAGIASSASGFAALTVATLAALGHDPLGAGFDRGELSSLARRSGSGSATRSVLGGYVEWPDPAAADDADPRAAQLAAAEHWELCDVVAVVETGAKEVSSLDGHRRATSSPHFSRRLEELPRRLGQVRRAIAERNLGRLGPVLEEEAVELHLVAMSSRPPIFYWRPGTLEVLAAVRALRDAGVGAWSTLDAGANVHVICAAGDEAAVAERLGALPAVRRVLRDRTGSGPAVHAEHLI